MHLEVLHSRSVMEAQCGTILGCSPHIDQEVPSYRGREIATVWLSAGSSA